MLLTETKKTYKSGKLQIDIEHNREKDWYSIVVWNADRSIVATFDSKEEATELIRAIGEVLMADKQS